MSTIRDCLQTVNHHSLRSSNFNLVSSKKEMKIFALEIISSMIQNKNDNQYINKKQYASYPTYMKMKKHM